MAGVISSAVAAGLAALIPLILIGLLSRGIGRSRPKLEEADEGAIAPERLSAAFTVLFGLLFLAGGIVAVLAGGPGLLYGGPAIAVGVLIAGFMAPSLTDLHIVRWTPEGVEGPSSMFGLTLGIRRTMIPWPDIRRTGKTATGYWYVENQDHRRVYWSYLYKGHDSFAKALKEQCPSLALPGDLG